MNNGNKQVVTEPRKPMSREQLEAMIEEEANREGLAILRVRGMIPKRKHIK